ncbi:hypothetical protein Ancab_022754 [Ancistrocladus abbreviatus]
MGSFEKLSTRSLQTDMPVMVKILELSEGAKDSMPLGQGAVYWQPPEQAVERVKQFAQEPSSSRYGTHEGLPELKVALMKKLQLENKLYNSSIMGHSRLKSGVFESCSCTLDPDTLQPDADWLARILGESEPVPKLVSIVNPGNPSGTCMPEPLLKSSMDAAIQTPIDNWMKWTCSLQLTIVTLPGTYFCCLALLLANRISDICRQAGSWLVVDNAYEYFVYDGYKHFCVEGRHVINLFSFSKAYGMMGWRVGYIAYSSEAEGLRTQLLKIQDNRGGRGWVANQVKTLERNRELLVEALSPLGNGNIKGGQGAIYLWAKLPDEYQNDIDVICWLARRHGVVLLPGSACGMPGCVRVTYGAVTEAECELAAKRLKSGLEELLRDGLATFPTC